MPSVTFICTNNHWHYEPFVSSYREPFGISYYEPFGISYKPIYIFHTNRPHQGRLVVFYPAFTPYTLHLTLYTLHSTPFPSHL